MQIVISIGCVDGITQHQRRTSKPQEILDLLHEYDHEGSNIGCSVQFDNAEEIYKIMEKLK